MNTAKIVQAIKNNPLSVHKLSIKCGVGYATLYDIAHGNAKNPRIDTVIKIAGVLNISVTELLSEEAEDEKSDT